MFTSVNEGVDTTNNEMTWMPNSNDVSASFSINEKLKLNLEKTEELQSSKNENGIDIHNIKPFVLLLILTDVNQLVFTKLYLSL